jgi:glycosyltransferase involved in cell wall biosynthesis
VIVGLAGVSPAIVFARDALPPSRVASASQRFVARRVACIVANSRFTAARFAAAAGCPAPTIIHPPVDLQRFSADGVDRSASRIRLGLSDDEAPVIGVVAQLTPWKGQLDAIEALEVVRVRHARATLLLAGAVKFGGPRTRFDNHAYEEALRRRAVDLGVGDSVRFLGEHADVRDILAALDLLFVPSWEEPFGRSLAEGMAFGLPAIATTIGGPAELVTDGVDGVLLPPRSPELWGETAAGLLADPARAASLGAAAARTARASFGVERHVADVLAMYGDVRGRAARGALGESRELPA